MNTDTPDRIEQLRRALDAGYIDRPTYDAAVAGMQASLQGDGNVLAQGAGAIAAANSAIVQGNNGGVINLGLMIQQAAQPGAAPADLRNAYLARILAQGNQLPFSVGDASGAQVKLSAVYTALLTERSAADSESRHGRPETLAALPNRERRLSAVNVLDIEPKLVLLGGPGSGKSTFVNFVALAMAGELLGAAQPNLATLTAPLPLPDDEKNAGKPPQPWTHGPLLPVQVILRDLASQLPPPGVPLDAQVVWRYVESRLQAALLGDFAPLLRAELLARGGIVLLDGLDEVPEAAQRREQIKQAVQEFAATFSRCRFLATSRTYAYQRQDWKLDGFAEAQLAPFAPAQIDAFVGAWYGHMAELHRLADADAADRAAVLKREVRRNPRLFELAERPLLLTLIAQLQTEGAGSLPEKPEELYDKAVDLLLNRWENMKVRVREDGGKDIEPSLAVWLNASRDDIRRQLNRLAFVAHRDQPDLAGATTADIPQGELVCALLASAGRADVDVGRLVAYLRDRAGILAAHGVGMYQFPHRSFQEYLAACHLTDDDFPDQVAGLARTAPNRWREAALLAAAKAARGSALNPWALAEALCPDAYATDAAAADHWGALLAGRVLVESADLKEVPPRNKGKLERIRRWQAELLRSGALPAHERALAGRSLAALGDPRREAMTLDGMEFCLVPAGPFEMGEEADEGAKPRHVVELAYPYLIGRYPVTVAQWRAFAQARGRDLPAGPDNAPVTAVSWHDALAFCEFLTLAWSERLPAGHVVSLPSEAEWEKAARGGTRVPLQPAWASVDRAAALLASAPGLQANPLPARAYPWGDAFDEGRANVESAVGQPSAVGCYPAGASPCGCEDMAGNVWEWTRSLWGMDLFTPDFAYPYDLQDIEREGIGAADKILRVVRGGSWGVRHDVARCAIRLRNRPGSRDDVIGFRVVLRSSPVVLPLNSVTPNSD